MWLLLFSMYSFILLLDSLHLIVLLLLGLFILGAELAGLYVPLHSTDIVLSISKMIQQIISSTRTNNNPISSHPNPNILLITHHNNSITNKIMIYTSIFKILKRLCLIYVLLGFCSWYLPFELEEFVVVCVLDVLAICQHVMIID